MPVDPIQAILNPAQLDRFRSVVGLGEGAPLQANFTGWRKHIIMGDGVVYFWPRNHTLVDSFQREVAAYRFLAPLKNPLLPELLAVYQDDGVSPYPFAAARAFPGILYGSQEGTISEQQVGLFLERLGELIGQWHELPTGDLPEILRHSPFPIADGPALDETLLPALWTPDIAPHTMALMRDRLAALGYDVPDANAWWPRLQPLITLRHVLVHGDVHEDQVLVTDTDSMTITGILDWETACLDHPLRDLGFSEWGIGIWAWKERFLPLRRRLWAGYARSRGLPADWADDLNLFFVLREIGWLLGQVESGGNSRDGIDAALRSCLKRLS